jgi:hypothetical protein
MEGGWHGEVTNMYHIFARICGEERPLGIHRYKWEDNIEMDLLRNRL